MTPLHPPSPLEPFLPPHLSLLLIPKDLSSLLRIVQPLLVLWTLCPPHAPRPFKDGVIAMTIVQIPALMSIETSLCPSMLQLSYLSLGRQMRWPLPKGHPNSWPSSTSPPSLVQAPSSPTFFAQTPLQWAVNTPRAPSLGQASCHLLSLRCKHLQYHICCQLLALFLPLPSAPVTTNQQLPLSEIHIPSSGIYLL